MNPNVVELTTPDPKFSCIFCSRHEVNAVEWGPMYKLGDVVLHYFCMLFSSGLVQDGADDQGVLGFLPKDIRKEVGRGKKLKCKYCRKSTATVGCIVPKCKASFHYPCGFENGSLHQFQGHFASYCKNHKPKQKIPQSASWECPICSDPVENEAQAVWPPCCGNYVFHRGCIMHAAKEAGYFFKCPMCNNATEFLEAMKANGVYVPEQDAAWETVPGAFAELTEHYSNCDAEPCICPDGKTFDSKDDKNWKLIRCGGCGASAIHVTCGNLHTYNWKCATCANVLARPSGAPERITSADALNSSSNFGSGARELRNPDSESSEESSSESESESSEEESSEDDDDDGSDSGKEVRIARKIPSAMELIQKRKKQQSIIETETDSDDGDDDMEGTEAEKGTIVSNFTGAESDPHAKGKGKDNPLVSNIAFRNPDTTPSRTNSYKDKNQGNVNSEQRPETLKQSHPHGKRSAVKFTTPPNRIRNPHLHFTPNFEQRLEQLRQSRARANMGMSTTEANEPMRLRLNSQLTVEQITVKAKETSDCINRVLAQANRTRVNVSDLPRIPKITKPVPEQVQIDGGQGQEESSEEDLPGLYSGRYQHGAPRPRTSQNLQPEIIPATVKPLMDDDSISKTNHPTCNRTPEPMLISPANETNTSPNSIPKSSPMKPLAQTRLDKWLASASSRKVSPNTNAPKTVPVRMPSPNLLIPIQTQVSEITSSMISEIDVDPEPIPVDVQIQNRPRPHRPSVEIEEIRISDDDDDNEIPGPSSSLKSGSSSTSSSIPPRVLADIQAQAKAKAAQREKFKPPNRSRHRRTNHKNMPEAFKPTVINATSDDDEIELIEERMGSASPRGKLLYPPDSSDLKRFEAIPRSSAFLSMISGHETNRFLGYTRWARQRQAQTTGPTPSSGEIDVVEILSSSSDEEKKTDNSAGLGLTTGRRREGGEDEGKSDEPKAKATNEEAKDKSNEEGDQEGNSQDNTQMDEGKKQYSSTAEWEIGATVDNSNGNGSGQSQSLRLKRKRTLAIVE